MIDRRFLAWTIATALLGANLAHAQPAAPDLNRQRAAIARLDPFDGAWRGDATIVKPGLPPIHIIQTERVGSGLGGGLKLIQGKSYRPDGQPAEFSALAVISFDDQAGSYNFSAYAQGRAGNFPLEVSDGGFSWTRPMGPNAELRYTATIDHRAWREQGWYEKDGRRIARVFDMLLRRIGGSDWPEGGAVQAK